MFRQFSLFLPTAALAMAALLPAWSAAQTAQGYGAASTTAAPSATATMGAAQTAAQPTQGYVFGPGAETVVCPGGLYGGFHPLNCRAYSGAGYYGFFRRYYGYPFYGPSYRFAPMSFDLGYGLGCGIAYRSGGYGLRRHGHSLPCSSGCDSPALPAEANPPGVSANAPAAPPAENPPPSANAAQVQLIVPENAEVLFDGSKMTQAGAIREFVSPPLAPGKSFTYQIIVRYTDANGKTIEEQRALRVRGNDRLRLDCTRPASAGATTLRAASPSGDFFLAR